MQRLEFPSPLSKSAEKILKMEAHFNFGVPASDLKPKMKALLDKDISGKESDRILKQKN
jgi:hypothetical protein